MRVRQTETLALRPRRQKNRCHGGCNANAIRVDVARHKLHGIVYRQTGRYGSARRIDVEVNVFLRLRHLKEKQLRDHRVCHGVVNFRSDKYDAVDQQPRVDVIRSLPLAGLLDDGRYVVTVAWCFHNAFADHSTIPFFP